MLGVTAYYKDVDVELRGAVLHANGDTTLDMTPAIYYKLRGVSNAEEQAKTEHICCASNAIGYAIDSFTFDKLAPLSINKVAYALAMPYSWPSLTRYKIGLNGIGHMLIFTIEF